jgi:hypothetical protein
LQSCYRENEEEKQQDNYGISQEWQWAEQCLHYAL